MCSVSTNPQTILTLVYPSRFISRPVSLSPRPGPVRDSRTVQVPSPLLLPGHTHSSSVGVRPYESAGLRPVHGWCRGERKRVRAPQATVSCAASTNHLVRTHSVRARGVRDGTSSRLTTRRSRGPRTKVVPVTIHRTSRLRPSVSTESGPGRLHSP